jgi:hypothetical protein
VWHTVENTGMVGVEMHGVLRHPCAKAIVVFSLGLA